MPGGSPCVASSAMTPLRTGIPCRLYTSTVRDVVCAGSVMADCPGSVGSEDGV